ncbi:hypothetical protein [Aureimonas leprariae]|uniref:Uncharacterized protein n=1 Tax=Plantimonas leprariae TaxID=2615207 RepID=A0A7V7TVT0_9HYPH|nr:hypothetical protein [Aureimonas leprariae]KAB0679056.1 hypothetical protein F6X38_14260 [Aureimonas leprariae]
MSPESRRRGLAKLMLRLPALRGELQVSFAHSEEVASLCSAFDEATATLDRLRRERAAADAAILAEYETVCREIEAELIRHCLAAI